MTSPTTTTGVTYSRKVTLEEYQQWKKEFTWEALQGQRYGQNFCNKFGISDNILYFERDPEWADSYIQRQYLIK